MKNSIHVPLVFIFVLAFSYFSRSQDLIFKTNGDTIRAKVIEVGTNGVSYKKKSNPDGPVFVEQKTNIRMIKFSNGEIQQFNQLEPISTATMSTNSMTTAATQTNAASSPTNTSQSQSGKIKIEMMNNKYTINGQKASRKDVDKMLGSSKNPAILVPLKAAKMTKTAQKIVKITSIPSTIGGGFTFLWKGVDMWNDIQRGRATSKSYINAAVSLLGTLTLPITNKILKNKSDKMYSKLIDMYNVTN